MQNSSSLDRGVFVLSLDFELAWGSAHGGKLARRDAQFQLARQCITGLLGLLDKYQISATWATVGHLFLDKCQPVNGVKHPEIVRPKYEWFPEDWFSVDPCSQLEDAPIWYGRDIIKQVLSCRVQQEIGCHTFSHVRAGDPGCSQECFDSELKLCRKVAGDIGIELKSFVYPWNSEGHHEILSSNGFIAYRGKERYWYAGLPRLVRKAAFLADGWLFFVPPPVVQPMKTGDCWNIAGSYFYREFGGLNKVVPMRARISKAKKGIDKALADKQVFHLWFHPFNLSSDPRSLLDGLEEIFAYVDSHVRSGDMKNLTMGQLAEALNAKHT